MDSERLIIIIGMAHSGTTILAHILNQHLGIVCYRDGSEAWIYENTALPLEQVEPIEQALEENPGKRILLKRPWMEVHHSDWMRRELPNARYLYCYRPFADIARSWSKPTSYIDAELRDDGGTQERVYQLCWDAAMEFKATTNHFRMMPHLDFLAEPKRVMTETIQWLGLEPWEFDFNDVSETINLKDVLRGSLPVWTGETIPSNQGLIIKESLLVDGLKAKPNDTGGI